MICRTSNEACEVLIVREFYLWPMTRELCHAFFREFEKDSVKGKGYGTQAEKVGIAVCLWNIRDGGGKCRYAGEKYKKSACVGKGWFSIYTRRRRL